jgi:SOS-response transcriptional repressor LexA
MKVVGILSCPHCGREVTEAATPRQRDVANFIAAFSREHGSRPTYDEIGQGVGVTSSATVHKHVHGLYKLGIIRKPRKPRRRGKQRSASL